MNIHKNARLTPLGRERMVRRILAGQTPQAAALAAGVCPATARKWLKRFLAEGVEGLADRSSRPKTLRNETPPETADRIVALRRERWTGRHIAAETGVSAATVSRLLKKAGLSRLKDLEPAEPIRRYERASPGEIIHIDIKKLGRFERPGHRVTGDRTGQSRPRSGKGSGYGWEYVHVAIDDHSRLSFTQIHENEKQESAVKHLKKAIGWYRSLGITVTAIMPPLIVCWQTTAGQRDNGSCYRSKTFAKACKVLNLRHRRTRPYTPKTNGKAERFIQTAMREWAYARAYETSDQRAAELPKWLHMYNWHRPHGGIKHKTPISRLGLKRNNLLRHHN